MKKILILIILSAFISGCSSSKYDLVYFNDNFFATGYDCSSPYLKLQFCRVYFLPSPYNEYIYYYLSEDNYDYEITKTFTEKGSPPVNYNDINIDGRLNGYEIKYLEDDKIQISEEIILEKKIEYSVDERLDGVYIYNGTKIIIRSKTGKIHSDIIDPISRSNGIKIYQLDTNIITLADSLISEYPIYYYEISNNGDILLYPLIGYYVNIKKQPYILEKQDYQ